MPIAFDFKPKGFKLKSIFSLFPWGVRTEEDKEDKIQAFIYHAQMVEERMAEIRIRLEKRSEELFRKVVAALRQGDRRKAEVYAAEVVHLKKMLKFIRAMELLAIKAGERAKTAKDAKELGEILLAFTAALDEVREQMKGLYPSLAIMYGEVARNVKMMLLETMPPDVTDIDVENVSREASRMLEEVLREAEKEIEDRFPTTSLEKILGDKTKIITKTGVLLADESVAGKTPTGKTSIEVRGAKKSVVSVNQCSQCGSEERVGGVQSRAGKRSSMVPVAGVEKKASSAVEYKRVERTGIQRDSKLSPEELERLLLDYIVVHGGFLDLTDFTRRYGVTKEEVLAALQRLHAKGLIRLA